MRGGAECVRGAAVLRASLRRVHAAFCAGWEWAGLMCGFG